VQTYFFPKGPHYELLPGTVGKSKVNMNNPLQALGGCSKIFFTPCCTCLPKHLQDQADCIQQG